MSNTEKLYFTKSVSSNSVGNGSHFNEEIGLAAPTSEEIKEFAAHATRPIRARQSRSRPDLMCLYQISHFEHLLEKLGFIFYNNQQRRRDTHFAIETSIRPMLGKEESSFKETCVADLHALVEQQEWTRSPAKPADGSTDQRATTHGKGLELIKSLTVGNAILVPDGISIAAVPASKVIAERIIRVADCMPGSINTDFSLIIPADNDHKFEDDESAPKINLEQQIAQRAIAADSNLIVIEILYEKNEDKELQNWAAAYGAAEKVRQDSKGKKSIMLVPSTKALKQKSEDASDKKVSKEKVLQDIQNFLTEDKAQRAKTSNKTNPYAFLDEQ